MAPPSAKSDVPRLETHAAAHLEADSWPRHRFIDGLTNQYLTRGARQRGFPIGEHQILLRSDAMGCQRAAVSAGWGIAAFPLWMADKEPDWVSVLTKEDRIDIEVWLVARPEVRDNEQLQRIFTCLADGLAQRLSPAKLDQVG